MKPKIPRDKFMGQAQVGAEGQIVIPEEVREMLHIELGEKLLLLADKKKGMALQRGAL
ncbi:MAG: AbrB/MazE/SpoVT family DNA-binding domain-containing protein [Oscillospiraceae bacterium]